MVISRTSKNPLAVNLAKIFMVVFYIELVNSVLNLPDGQVSFLGDSNYKKLVINPAHQIFWGVLK